MLGPRSRYPRLGSLVRVEWLDITSTCNSTLSEAKPVGCTTIGRLVKKTDSFVVVATSIFDEPGHEMNGDFVAIPMGVLLKVAVVK